MEIPTNIHKALENHKWKEGVLEQMKVLVGNQTWDIVELPEDKKIVSCKWIFTVKYNADSRIERCKARLVAQGLTQTYGVDYEETFAPIAKLNSIRVLLSMAANLDWELHQSNIKNVLNGKLEEEVYMQIPLEFESAKNLGKVCKLKKALHGLKQSPRAWFTKFMQP